MSRKLVLNYEVGSSMVIDLKYVTDIFVLEDDDLFHDSSGKRIYENGLQKENEKKLVEKEFSKRSWCKKSQLGR